YGETAAVYVAVESR
nr:RecName: Full=Polymeric immunoglobulin receptor; Short=PIgR; Short=Poly-Ig receptor; Contains: RecName: Full=Secretory component [Capra hircus]